VSNCQVVQLTHVDEFFRLPRIATKQYQLFGFRWVNFVIPFTPVFCVRNGVPGRGLDVDAGVDISTGIYAAGEPWAFVTATVAAVIVGSGV
jgi:hypothetical protein